MLLTRRHGTIYSGFKQKTPTTQKRTDDATKSGALAGRARRLSDKTALNPRETSAPTGEDGTGSHKISCAVWGLEADCGLKGL